jgi:hypothetical protein
MRRFVIATVAVLAVAAPSAAYAATATHSFTLSRAHTGYAFKLHLAHKGRIQVVVRYSKVRHPKADILVNLRQQGDPDGNIVLDTGGSGQGCTTAAGNYVCSVYISGLAAGNWFVTIAEDKAGTVPVHARLSWPAT